MSQHGNILQKNYEVTMDNDPNLIKLENAEKVLSYFRKNWQLDKCSMCGASDWSVNQADDGIMNALVGFNPNNNSATSDRLFPAILISCTNCGYAHMASAVIVERKMAAGERNDA